MASASRGRGRGGLWALGIVCVAAAGTVYWVHHSQKEERRVTRPVRTPRASRCVPAHVRATSRAQTMREAVLRDIEKLGR